MTDIEQHDSVEVFVGVDVRKGTLHAAALDRKGKRLLDTALPNDETKLRALIGKLSGYGKVLIVVDQPATAGFFQCGGWRRRRFSGLFAYSPGLAVRRIADLQALGNATSCIAKATAGGGERSRAPCACATSSPGS
jgi:Transposase